MIELAVLALFTLALIFFLLLLAGLRFEML